MARPLKLTDDEQPLYDELKHLVEELQSLYETERPDEKRIETALFRASETAHLLHAKLKLRGHMPHYHTYTSEGPELTPNSVKFYQHIHPCEDLLRFVEDPDFAKGPAPLPLDLTFDFPIYSRHRGYEHPYRLKRTESGWQVLGTIMIGKKPADKRGYPSIFDIFRHDGICYPEGIDALLERAWIMASGHATEAEVRQTIKDLAEWISICERNAPRLAGNIADISREKHGAVTLLDVLGWKGIWSHDPYAAEKLLSVIEEAKQIAKHVTYRLRGRHKTLESFSLSTLVLNISDTIALYTPAPPEEAIAIHAEICAELLPYALEFGLPLRGAISYGRYATTGNVMVGYAVDEAASWYESTDWLGVILTPSAHVLVSDTISSAIVDYPSIPFKKHVNHLRKCVAWEYTGRGRIKDIFIAKGPLTTDIADKYLNTLAFLKEMNRRNTQGGTAAHLGEAVPQQDEAGSQRHD